MTTASKLVRRLDVFYFNILSQKFRGSTILFTILFTVLKFLNEMFYLKCCHAGSTCFLFVLEQILLEVGCILILWTLFHLERGSSRYNYFIGVAVVCCIALPSSAANAWLTRNYDIMGKFEISNKNKNSKSNLFLCTHL